MIPLFTTNQIRKADQYAANKLKIAGIVLMENAARSIVEISLTEIPDFILHQKVGIICGKGNNGGDGFTVARHLTNLGFNVKVILIAGERELKGDALVNFKILWEQSKLTRNVSIKFYSKVSDLNTLKDCTVIYDAILGSGTVGEIKDPYKSIIECLNRMDAVKIAIDIPSGLNANTGYGKIVFNADLTITLAELKRGLFFNSGYIFSGDVAKGSIGIGSEFFDNLTVEDYLVEPEDAMFGIPIRQLNSHKYNSGKVLVIAGSASLPGAAFLTANSAIRCGAGAVILTVPKSLRKLAQQKLSEATVQSYGNNESEILTVDDVPELEVKIKWADVIAIGPGLGRDESTISAVRKILNQFPNKKFIIDADAVIALGKNYYKEVNLRNKILTPHYKEFCKLIDVELEELHSNILNYGKRFAVRTQTYLVLKGAPSIIFTPAGDALINTTGNPGMAKFGTGDVLTGILAAYVSTTSNFESACISAVYLHSLSADLLAFQKTENTYTATDILNNFTNAVRFLEDSII